QPHLPTLAYCTGYGHSGRFDLSVVDPAGLEREEAVVPEVDLDAALGLAAHPPAVLLAVLDLLRREHGYSASFGFGVSSGLVTGSADWAVSTSTGSADWAVPASAGSAGAVPASAGSASSGFSSPCAFSGSGSSTSASSFTSVMRAPVDEPPAPRA